MARIFATSITGPTVLSSSPRLYWNALGAMAPFAGGSGPPTVECFLLLETGDDILLETGDKILLENCTPLISAILTETPGAGLPITTESGARLITEAS